MPPARYDLIPGTLDLLILKTLSLGADHGYGIARAIERMSSEVLLVEEGSLYPALHRMEKRGVIASNWERSDTNRRVKVYSLTTTGRSALKSDAAAWQAVSGAVGRILNAKAAVAREIVA